MINVDISNVWTCVNLMELLSREKELFDAHNLLRNHQPDGPDLHGWLGLPDAVHTRQIHSIRKTAEKICANSDLLLVCGTGSAYWGAKAAIDLYCGADGCRGPEIRFVGNSLSSRQWLSLNQQLDGRDYSLHIISDDGCDVGTNIISRGLRWKMERKYGAQTKARVSVATVVGSPLHRMGQEEGYELFPMPKELGGTHTVLTAAAMLPMAVAGIDPLGVLEGAVETYEETDIRAFENPVWLYAGSRLLLSGKGLCRELLCYADPGLRAFAQWWQRHVWLVEGGKTSVSGLQVPGDLTAADDLCLRGDSGFFETVLQMEEPALQNVPVEMDWKDYDGLGFLSGKNLAQVEQAMMSALIASHYNAGVPVLDLQLGELTPQTIGSLFCFFELAAALTACVRGVPLFAPAGHTTMQQALESLREND